MQTPNTLQSLSIVVVPLLLVACAGATPTVSPVPSPSSAPTATAIPSATAPPTSNPEQTERPEEPSDLLADAVDRLQEAASFRMAAHEVRAYEIIPPGGAIRSIYGEFESEYLVVRRPELSVRARLRYRYNPDDDLIQSEWYARREGGEYRISTVEGSEITEREIDPEQIEPLAGDVYRTLVTYAGRAEAVSRDGDTAVYVLEHPAWYELTGAIGFADLGFLQAQENGEELVRQYAADHYPNVAPIRFTIHVDVASREISRVDVDDADWMASLWAEVDRALLAEGAATGSLTRYRVLEANGATFAFDDYDRVQAAPDSA